MAFSIGESAEAAAARDVDDAAIGDLTARRAGVCGFARRRTLGEALGVDGCGPDLDRAREPRRGVGCSYAVRLHLEGIERTARRRDGQDDVLQTDR